MEHLTLIDEVFSHCIVLFLEIKCVLTLLTLKYRYMACTIYKLIMVELWVLDFLGTAKMKEGQSTTDF